MRDETTAIPTWVRVAIVLGPIVLSLLAHALAPNYFDPMFAAPPDWMGIPLGLVLNAIAVGWGLLGGLLVARSRQPYVLTIGFLVFTIPACLVIIFAPAIILILQNWG